MDTLIAMQDIRSGLASIADRAASGESFIVVRNSRPAFRIIPLDQSVAVPGCKTKLREVRERLADYPVRKGELSPCDLDAVIREVRKHRKAHA
ncbi:MAG: hypothetical protein WC328_04870 [Kiritimatiellia bacterium]